IPRSAARNAAAYPPGPPSITASCVLFVLSLIVFPVAPMTPTLVLAYALAGFLSIRLTYRVVRTTLVYDPSTHTNSPRRSPRRRAQGGRPFRRRTGPHARRASQPHLADHCRQASDRRRHSPAFGTLLRHQPGPLGEPAKDLRARP